jgi:phosphinothricin acetyltransferase
MPSCETMMELRAARLSDLPQLVEIYNHYTLHTPITFDMHAQTVDERRAWFDKYAEAGRHRLLVAVDGGNVVGYASSSQFRAKPAYDSTVETTVYCAPDQQRRGVGSALYSALFAALSGEDIASYVAGITVPNAASFALHARFGFKHIGVMHRVGVKFYGYWDVAWLERLEAHS